MAEPYLFQSMAGIRRDGTELDSPFYADGVWVRFQRGRPRKMGGYRAMSRLANGPVRAVHVDNRNNVNSAHYMGYWGVQRQEFSDDGAGGALVDRTPLSFTVGDYTWTSSVLYSSTGGTGSTFVCAATPDLSDVGSDTAGPVYSGNIATGSILTPVADGSGNITVSGGVTVLQPFLVVYGSNGLIRNSNANDFSSATGWTTGGANFANTANVAGTKIVYGAPVRGGGQSPAGLFWAMDALIRMSFNNVANSIWSYDTISQPTSIMSKRCVVEHDGRFFWPGIDRFLMYNGVVQELPNQMNINWFFDNLSIANHNKVWGTKIPRYGEIWWFFPYGSATECNKAVIFNYQENTWYDAELQRYSGSHPGLAHFPVWVGAENSQATTKLITGVRLQTSAQTLTGSAVLTFVSTTGVVDGMTVSVAGIPAGSTVFSHTATTVTCTAVATSDIASGTLVLFQSMALPFVIGGTVTGGTSLATGTLVRVEETSLNVLTSTMTGTFVSGETLTSAARTAVLQSAPVSQELDTIFQHEFGKDKIVDSDVTALRSSFTSANFGFAVGGPFGDVPKMVDKRTIVKRLEPDFDPVGDLQVSFRGRDFAQDPDEQVGETMTVTASSSYIDPRNVQARILSMVVESNELGGDFFAGQQILHLEIGDGRSNKST